jgi:hypothetical protein
LYRDVFKGTYYIKELILSPKTGIASTNNQIKSFLMGREFPLLYFFFFVFVCFEGLSGQVSGVKVEPSSWITSQSLSKDVFPVDLCQSNRSQAALLFSMISDSGP